MLFLLILPHHGNDAAQDRALAAVDGLVVGVRGHEPDLAALALERFDRRLVTKQRDHDLPVVAPDCPAAEMIHAISKGGLGLIVICDGDRIEGIVTDGDVRRAGSSSISGLPTSPRAIPRPSRRTRN